VAQNRENCPKQGIAAVIQGFGCLVEEVVQCDNQKVFKVVILKPFLRSCPLLPLGLSAATPTTPRPWYQCSVKDGQEHGCQSNLDMTGHNFK